MTHPLWGSLLLLLVVACIAWSTNSLQEDICSAGDPYRVDIEPDADVKIGAVLNLHHSGQGLFGCGPPSAEGIQYFEALKWAVSTLNRESGDVSGINVTDSFIPGVKFGLQVYDSCEHRDLAMRYITELFPVMKSGYSLCNHHGGDNSSSIIGMVDASNILRDPRVAETTSRYIIPVIPLRQENTVPPEHMAKILGEVVHDMDWAKIAILHEDDEYSIFVTKVFSQMAKSGYPCIRAIESLPSLEDKKDISSKSFNKILASFTSKLTDNTGVIVIGQGKVIDRMIQAFNESLNSFSRLQWFFSWIPPFSMLRKLQSTVSKLHFYSLSPYPKDITAFEEYWEELSSSHSDEDQFFLEYLQLQNNCELPEVKDHAMCDNFTLIEEPTDVLMRTARFLPTMHSIFTFAHAYHKAWAEKCLSIPGICKQLKSMSRREFVEEYLEALEFEHNPKARSPFEVRGQKTSQGMSGEIEGMQLALTMYSLSPSTGLQFKQVLSYDAQETKVLDPTFRYESSVCPKGGCKDCISVRQSRLEDHYVGMSSMGDITITSQSDEISIPILLPIHKPGTNPLECSEEINPQAIQDLEAALWTVDQINRDTEFLPDIHLRVISIDTCSSTVQITQKVSNYLLDNKKKDLEDISSDLAFIVTGNPDEVKATTSIVAPLNVTTISVTDSIRPKDMDDLHLQVEIPLEKKTKATVDTLVYLGWNYVTVIHDGDARSELMLDSFKTFAKEYDICVSSDLSPIEITDSEMDKILIKVVEAKKNGARAVVMWTNEKTTQYFLRAVHRAVLAGLISRGDLVILSSEDWIVNLQSFKEFENQVTGVIVLKTQQGEVEDFITYFQRLDPNENKRNPWFRELWHQKQECKDKKCESANNDQPITYQPSSSTINIIQGLLAVSAGLARLRNELCHPKPGLCSKMLQTVQLRKQLFGYIRETASSRLDARGEMFAFTKQGYGNLPIEIFNFRRAAGKNFVYQKVGMYQNHLNNLAEIVMYNSDGQEISVDQLSSKCRENCSMCGRRPTDFVILDSKDHLYLAISVDIHEPAVNPLTCSAYVKPSGMQMLEAFLWALDQINSSPQLLPGINLGAIIFDTCSSKEKAARDVANFFSSSISATTSHKLPSVNQILGLVATQTDKIIQPIIDVSMPFGMMTVAPRVTSTIFNDKTKYPTLLRLSLPNDIRAGALVNVLKHFKWNYVSVLYSDEAQMQLNLFESFRKKAEFREIEFAMVEKVPYFSNSAMSLLFNKLQSKRNEGASVVLLFLSIKESSKLFSVVKTELDGGRIDIGNFVWVSFENMDPFHQYPLASLGALMIEPSYTNVISFKQYFSGLSPRNNSRNPWFRDYWEQVYRCKGEKCRRNHPGLSEISSLQDSCIAKVINSVLSVGVGLEALRQQVCPGLDHGLCSEMRGDPRVRKILFNLTLESTFTGADGKMFRFTNNGYAANLLDVLNFRQIGNNAHAFVNVGQYSPDEGLALNFSKIKTYNEFGKEISLYDIKSVCNGCREQSKNIFSETMQVVSKQNFAISITMPIHKKSRNFFSCGELKDESIFHHLISIAYALDKINNNATLMPGIELGAIVFDYCERPQKGEELLFSFLSHGKEINNKLQIKPKSIIAAITYGKEMSKESLPIFDSLDITHVATPIDRMEPDSNNDVLYTAPSMLSQVQALIGILNKFKWQFVNVVYSNTDFGRAGYYLFSKNAKESDVCLANVVLIEPDSTQESLLMNLQNGLSRDANVVVSLVDDDLVVQSMIEAIKNSFILSKYVWIGTETWGDNALARRSLENSAFDAITLKMEGYDMPEFGKFYERLSLWNHYPIPDLWFEEFWQHRFQCQLTNSLVQQRQYASVCTGKEQLSSNDLSQSEHIYQTVRTVEAIAEGLHNYLNMKCPYGMMATSIDDCGNDSRKDLYKEIKIALHGVYVECEECGSPSTIFGYDILQHSRSGNGLHVHTQIGNWKNKEISINESKVSFSHNHVPQSQCSDECDNCMSQLGPMQTLKYPEQPIYANFQTVWGIIVTALSILGMVLVIICALYFLMSFPITVGTTVLGYMILFGLLLLYSVNFAFILAPTEGTCGIRRFGLGLAYAIIFSGMLVKVMNTWRLMGYNGSRILSDGTRLSSPAGLLVIAAGLVIIQIVLSAAWLILMPPKTGTYEEVWRCAPPTTFEEGLVVSLIYVMLLLAITTLFAMLTWQCQDNNRESRWILACALLVAIVWLTWTILSTQLPPHYRDTTIAAANLLNATIIMIFLYLRKVYLYSKLTRQARDQDLKAHLQPTAYSHSIYGSSQKTFSTLAPVLYGSQASLTTKKLYNTPSSRVELINCPEDNKSDSSGSVQVQATDLYPLDMYDGGSQFQPVTSLYGSNHTLVLDDTLTFGR